MNGTFFDAELSCAALMSSAVAWFDPSLLAGSWQVVPAIWGTVIVEATLPVLLAIPRTRVAGLLLGGAFHLVLALAGNVPFTAVMLAFYVAFLPPGLPAWAHAALSGGRGFALVSRLRRVPGWIEPVAFAGLVGCWMGGALLSPAEPAIAEALIDNGTRLLVVVAILLAAFGLTRWRARPAAASAPRRAGRSLRLGHPVFVLGTLLLVANALTPYLGLKTATSFNMFSNLRTEPGRWNHAFVPESVRIFGYQDQQVRVGTAAGSPDAGLIAEKVARLQPVPEPGEPGC